MDVSISNKTSEFSRLLDSMMCYFWDIRGCFLFSFLPIVTLSISPSRNHLPEFTTLISVVHPFHREGDRQTNVISGLRSGETLGTENVY